MFAKQQSGVWTFQNTIRMGCYMKMMLNSLIFVAVLGVSIWQIAGSMKDTKTAMTELNKATQESAALDELAKTGTKAKGKIIAVKETGSSINFNPEIRFLVEVQGKKPYQVTFDAVIPQLSLSKIQAGNIVPIRIDPKDPNRAVLDRGE
jgi:hypothetical protein